MEQTLDPIRPSESDMYHGEMSYVYGRDPSILAYSQRPLINVKKNLYSSYEIEESIKDVTSASLSKLSMQTIRVYLRMKPFSQISQLTEQQQKAYRIINSTTLLTELPNVNNSGFSSLKTAQETVCRRYIFTETFGPDVTQSEFFEQAVKSQISEFILGRNCTIMTYGTTNSGKSYTLQGTPTSPGIIPRGLEFLFANITAKSSSSYKPIHNCDVVTLSSVEKAQELEIKNKLLAFITTDKIQSIAAYKRIQENVDEKTLQGNSRTCNNSYSVWVSFAEIYNEVIYDLLSNDCQNRRAPMKLATDINGIAFIKGLKTICVKSAAEAFQVLMVGQYNLKVAVTALNPKSSRSHCIFSIKLLKYTTENDPQSVRVSTFSFCDLAGSERLKKTLNIGDRLKEAQNINMSLLVLGRCLKSIYEGQSIKSRNDVVGPFRESKLTRIFQQALSGNETMALIVNVNPTPNLYVETQNVLNFAAIAKKIMLKPQKSNRPKLKSRFSQVVENSTKNIIDWDNAVELESIEENSSLELEPSSSNQSEDYVYLLNENVKLREEISELKNSALNRDFEIRQQMAQTYLEMLKRVENDFNNQLKNIEEQHEELTQYNYDRIETYWKQKLNKVMSRKRLRLECDDGYNEEDSVNVIKLESEITDLKSKTTLLRRTNKDISQQKNSLQVAKNTVEYEVSLLKEDLKNTKSLLPSLQNDLDVNDEAHAFIEEIQLQLSETSERNKLLKNYLNEAQQDYINVRAEIESKNRLIHERDDLIAEQTEKIQDLENHLHSTNSILAEKIKHIDELEEKLERQSEHLMNDDIPVIVVKDTHTNITNEETLHKINENVCGNRINDNETIIELQENFKNCKKQKSILSEKLFQYLSEIKNLKHNLNVAKNYMIKLDERLNDSKMHNINKRKSVQTTTQIKTEGASLMDAEKDDLMEKWSSTEEQSEKAKKNLNELQEKYMVSKDKVSDLECNMEKLQLEEGKLKYKLPDNIEKIEVKNDKTGELTTKLQETDDTVTATPHYLNQRSKQMSNCTEVETIIVSKKSSRKKKLFTDDEVSFIDIIPGNESSPTATNARSLRARRKKK